ncbi:pilus assembly protein CpaB [Vibrio crassostreae]|uniref:pilus assembly protein CpaB n=1 Tax=Vibrio splendidus TaxID=29497 RepID=UPI002468BF76|nr:pilus assembly protein CpaB [Vibrio splendidus]CAK2824203.1 pilus assembly protein CpaB [Vibrio crassostreae]MDH5939488.1 pilus assembly protein CpaB [Vibrio splendidus]CAK2824655.1 pilus assembly protein CpaB [Vibrio crassostreae]CAK2829124.1 pilus assembly protein CpaB [Vibrio crassostreae]CAK2830686.1 pilus assembly protein CpaB [Vibrio crassostreae]
MNRPILFLFIAISLFLVFFFVSENFLSQEDEVVVEKEKIRMVDVAFLNNDVVKASVVKKQLLDIQSLPETTLKARGYTPYSDVNIQTGALWSANVQSGQAFNADYFSNPGDKDYMYLSLSKNEVPYYYTSSGSSIVEALPIQPQDRVSFVATTSSESNLLEDGYSDINNLTSNVIIDGARVLQVVESNNEDTEHSLIIALTVKQVLKLEMAQKIGAITLVPAKLAHKYLSVKSSDLIEHRFGVRQLRGN